LVLPYPGRPETRFDFARFEILGLDGAQRFHVALVGGIDLRGDPGRDQLGTDVTAEVTVGWFPFAAFGVPVSG
jgi:hypothetical protein